jgi:hypothetical protein
MPFKKELYIILLLLLPACLFSQNEITLTKDSLAINFGYEKTFIAGYELPALVALSNYPELDSTRIELKSRRIKHFGNARPKIDFLFRKQETRHYIIIINKKSRDILGFSFSDLPFGAQVGFFGHELAHISDYCGRNNLQIISYGIKYLFMKRSVERSTDRIAIKHNLGEQLYDLRCFVLNNPHTDKDYMEYKHNNYLDCEEIIKEISKLNESLQNE